MQNKITIVIATRNKGKKSEISDLLKGFSIDIKGLDDFGPIPHIEEDGDTFDENAYKKASFTARMLGFPALADDSGLLAEALEGAPGVLSARYTGPALTYEARCEGLIAEQPSGSNGFGYDPVFYYPPLNKTFGELTIEEKSHVSHRGKALRELRDEFDKVIIWIKQHMPGYEKFNCDDG